MIGVSDPSATRVGVALQVRMVQSSVTSTALRIGTRGSPLALAQAHEVRDRLAAVHGLEAAAIEVCTIRTSGDRIQDRTLAEAGGKGLFTKEIEEALCEVAIDLAVHSAKDMSTILPDGLALAAFLPREDARDAFVSRTAGTLGELAPGSLVGTASLRRQALVRRLRPDLAVVPLRGNVDTRLRKLDEGIIDATLLALAGLKRLGRADAATAVMPLDDFPPAIGQGAIAIEARSDDARLLALLTAINHEDTATALAAERAFLAVLDGSCRTPIAGHAIVSDGVAFRGMILRPDGSETYETRRRGSRAEAAALGADAGRELKARAPADFFAHG
jgi:hydroxymethylbilane synthase